MGQINSMNPDELKELKSRLLPYMEKALGAHGETMLFFMLTDIIHQSTELLCYGGENASAWSRRLSIRHRWTIPSSCPAWCHRKKQLIPAFMSALQQ